MSGTRSRGGHLSRMVSRLVLADAPSCLSQALRDRLSSCDMMVTCLRLLKACANQLFPAPAEGAFCGMILSRGKLNKGMRLPECKLPFSLRALSCDNAVVPNMAYHGSVSLALFDCHSRHSRWHR